MRHDGGESVIQVVEEIRMSLRGGATTPAKALGPDGGELWREFDR